MIFKKKNKDKDIDKVDKEQLPVIIHFSFGHLINSTHAHNIDNKE